MRHQSNGGIGGGSPHFVKPYIVGAGYLGDNYRDTKPVPPLAEYKAYEETLPTAQRKAFNPSMVRRIAILLREGETLQGACKLIGLRRNYGKSQAYTLMPDSLK